MRLMIVDDSVLVRGIVKGIILQSNRNIDIVGEASNGQQAIELNLKLEPDLIILDLNMPLMDGIEATKKIMESRPVPILILSGFLDGNKIFQAINNGAVDVMNKPEIEKFNEPEFFEGFIDKLINISKVKIEKYLYQKSNTEYKKSDFEPKYESQNNHYKIVVIGASTGGPKALSYLLKNIPSNFPIGIVLAQHIETGFDTSFVNWLDGETSLKVRLAKNNDVPKNGEVLVAPADKHLVFYYNRLILDDGPKVLNQKPSVDVLFKSAAKDYGKDLIAVLLTGMGNDGAEGCVEIKKMSGYTIVQDKETSDIFGMPKAAIELGGATKILPLDSIPKFLTQLVSLK